MLYSISHGQTIAISKKSRGTESGKTMPGDYVELNDVASIAKSREWKDKDPTPVPDPYPDTEPGLEPRQVFRYYCKNAAQVAAIDDAAAKFRALADAMAEENLDQKDEAGESDVPPIFTYFGQFIDHDITVNTDGDDDTTPETAKFSIGRPDFAPQPRDEAEKVKLNLRNGRLDLDSVYGDGPMQAPAALALEKALRDPDDKAKMRLGTVTPVSNGTPFFTRPDLPTDDNADLPRVGAAVDSGDLTMSDVNELFNADGSKSEAEVRRLALIGDGRNDENLIVAQFHLSILRLHNAIADTLRDDGMSGDDAIFKEARKQVTHLYQWLVVNVFLKTVCDPVVVDQVISDKAPLYSKFYDAHKGEMDPGVRPMPMEFSVAAYRFGHSMVRGDYDYNRSFGRDPSGNGDGRAGFNFMFQFTGRGGLSDQPTLPDNWIIEWDRFVGSAPLPNRTARKIDTRLALPLKSLGNDGSGNMIAHLAERNLRRGYVFNIPSAQEMIKCFYDMGIAIAPLDKDQIVSGTDAMRSAVTGGGFDTATPLWFYVLKEAEVKANGSHLGPLGSRIVAETLVGLLVTDPHSYLNQGTFGSWTPAQMAQPGGAPIDSLVAMLQACGVHAAGASRTAGTTESAGAPA